MKTSNKIRIGFVLPRDLHNYKPFRNQPLNALYLLTLIEREFGKNAEISIIDLRCVSKENIVYYVPKKDLYLYSVATIDYPETVRTVGEIRKAYPLARHVAGGIHINIYPEKSAEVFDAVALGDGEYIVSGIVRDAMAGALKKVYLDERPIDINAFPYPDRKFLPNTAIADTGFLNAPYSGLPGTGVLFSRGCPYKCDFCANLVQAPARFRKPDLITKEIEYLKKDYGVKALVIKDDNIFALNSEVARQTLAAIGKTGVKWRANSRANDVPRALIKMAKEAGCVDLAVGVESVSQKVLDLIHKRLDFGKAKDFLGLLREEGIGIRLNLIIGLPGEPKDIAKRTIAFIKAVRPSSVLLSILTPVPGSMIFKDL